MAYDAKKIYYRFDDHLSRLVLDYEASRQISPESENLYHGLPTDPYDEGLFVEHNVKRGLRNADGSGVVAGLTRISDVHGYNKIDGKVVPDQGKLTLRGYSIEDLVNNAQAENRYGYEEVAYLLITGSLPNKEELDGFCERLGAFRHLSDEYVKEFPMTTVSSSIMNVLQRAVLLLYAFDAEPDVITPEHEIDVAISMLARLPRIAAFAHMASVAKLRGSEVHVPHPTPGLSTAETILQVLRGGLAFALQLRLGLACLLFAPRLGLTGFLLLARLLGTKVFDRLPGTENIHEYKSLHRGVFLLQPDIFADKPLQGIVDGHQRLGKVLPPHRRGKLSGTSQHRGLERIESPGKVIDRLGQPDVVLALAEHRPQAVDRSPALGRPGVAVAQESPVPLPVIVGQLLFIGLHRLLRADDRPREEIPVVGLVVRRIFVQHGEGFEAFLRRFGLRRRDQARHGRFQFGTLHGGELGRFPSGLLLPRPEDRSLRRGVYLQPLRFGIQLLLARRIERPGPRRPHDERTVLLARLLLAVLAALRRLDIIFQRHLLAALRAHDTVV